MKSLFRLGSLAALMGIFVGYLAQYVDWQEGGRTLHKTICLFGLIGLGMGFYLGGAYLLRFTEFQEFFRRRAAS
jgi:peptidoglycan biosynthesis protein MviN/MurJ (putative lipid II flippase)